MSFMNPVDMVEEDAADLQFPKVNLEAQKTTRTTVRRKFIEARCDADTKYVTVYYDAKDFNKTIEEESNGDGESASTNNVEHCALCRNVLYEPYIKCSDCVDNILICVQCFAQGRQTATHRNSHAYVVVRDDIQVFPGASSWNAREERILLRTLEKQGYGNWEAVANALQGRHTPDECREHYHDFYFGGIFERLLGLTHESQCYFPQRFPYMAKLRSVDPPRTDDTSSMQFKMMAGYRCARGDFDTPYDMSAESILALLIPSREEASDDMDCAAEDEEMPDDNTRLAEEQLRMAMVRAYNHRLSERERRYRIMRDNGLIMPNRTLGWISKYAEALGSEANCNRFLSFMQICKPISFDLLVESLKYFSDVQKNIFRLYEWRQNGIRTLHGGNLYLNLKKSRLQEQQELVKDDVQRQLYDWRRLVPNAKASGVHPFTAGSAAVTNQRKKPGPMDIIGMPGYTKLTDGERKLCSVERIAPQSYLDYKNILIAENIKMGHLRLADARRLIKIDVNKTRQIYDFLIENGHINKPM